MKRISAERMQKELVQLASAKSKVRVELRRAESAYAKFYAQWLDFKAAWDKEYKRRGISHSQLVRSGFRYDGLTYTMFTNLDGACKALESEIEYLRGFLKGINSQITWRENKLDSMGAK